jgi:toxin-antitoxin system PIN domain toxin
MIIPDLDLLIYAYNSESPFHGRAREWWIRSLGGKQIVGLPWPVVFGFIRLCTSQRVFANPMSIQLATSHAESWLQRPNVKVLNPGPRHAEFAFELLRKEGSGGNLTTDAQLAALAIEAGATLFIKRGPNGNAGGVVGLRGAEGADLRHAAAVDCGRSLAQ